MDQPFVKRPFADDIADEDELFRLRKELAAVNKELATAMTARGEEGTPMTTEELDLLRNNGRKGGPGLSTLDGLALLDEVSRLVAEVRWLDERAERAERERDEGRETLLVATEALETTAEHSVVKRKEAEARVAALERVAEALIALLASDTPHTLEHDLRLLAGAVRHLMVDHGCDQHGWENVGEAQKRALAFADLAAKAHRAALDAAKDEGGQCAKCGDLGYIVSEVFSRLHNPERGAEACSCPKGAEWARERAALDAAKEGKP